MEGLLAPIGLLIWATQNGAKAMIEPVNKLFEGYASRKT